MAIVLTNNAKFTPYTFDEMLKPLAMATQEYNAIEEGIAELGTKADLMRMYASEEPDSDWAKRYNDYAKELDKQASSLAKYGLSPASRKGLLDLKRAYSSSVSPIEEAAKARKEAYKYRDTIRAKDNTAVFKNNTLSLSDFMNGKEGDNTYVSGKDLMTRVASKAQIEGTNMFNKLLEQGYSSEAALQAVNNWSRSVDNPIVTEELKALGLDNYSTEDQAKLINSIGTGMYNAASEIAKGEYLTKKERESLALQRDNLAESQRQHNLAIQSKGYKIDKGKIVVDETSPYWALNGIEWKEGKPLYKNPKQSSSYQNMGQGKALKTNPDGSYEVIDIPGYNKANKSGKIFAGLQFKMWNNKSSTIDFQEGLTNNKWTQGNTGFEDEDRTQINFTDLSSAMQNNIKSKLAEYGLTENDVIIEVDEDSITDNHYQVRLKTEEEKNNNQTPIKGPSYTGGWGE